ncbi:MAG: HEPN domain-containing protein [Burkholderiales bacterium]
MKPLTREWVDKAEGDRSTAQRELRVRKSPNFDAVCFHAQQCAEKYLKALLQERAAAIPHTHNLEALAKPMLASNPALAALTTDLRTLGAYAVETRYPGRSTDRAMAKEAFGHCEAIRAAVGKILRKPQFRGR